VNADPLAARAEEYHRILEDITRQHGGNFSPAMDAVAKQLALLLADPVGDPIEVSKTIVALSGLLPEPKIDPSAAASIDLAKFHPGELELFQALVAVLENEEPGEGARLPAGLPPTWWAPVHREVDKAVLRHWVNTALRNRIEGLERANAYWQREFKRLEGEGLVWRAADGSFVWHTFKAAPPRNVVPIGASRK
jgi:hypothetical protein